MPPLTEQLILLRGGGDLASGVAHRLHRAGFPVVITELAQPLCVRRTVAFAEAVYAGAITVEGVTARLVADANAARVTLAAREIPVLIDPQGGALAELQPAVVVDARLAKRNLGTTLTDAPLVIGLGPGFTAGADCHVVVETNRGHNLGRVYWQGGAEPDTGQPEPVRGFSVDRVLRAPRAGIFVGHKQIGEAVSAGEIVAEVDSAPLVAPFAGVLRGLLHDGLTVTAGLKVGDLDPRGVREHCFTISDKARAVGGGVLEAVLAASPLSLRERACPELAEGAGGEGEIPTMQLAAALQLSTGDCVAFVGAGGKTTALFRLARELAEAGRRVLTTTTTHLALEQGGLAPLHLIWPEATSPQIEAALSEHRHILVTGPADQALGKWTGLSAPTVADLRALAEVVLVEADGARQLSFKAPAEHEPAIPACATMVVVVVSLDVLGQPLTTAHVHRPERVAALTGAALGDPVTVETMARVLSHPLGGRKNVPLGARLVALLNKAETVESLAAAGELAALLLAKGGYHRVFAGSLAGEPPVHLSFGG